MSTEVVERMGIKCSSIGSSEGSRTFMACTPSWKVCKSALVTSSSDDLWYTCWSVGHSAPCCIHVRHRRQE
jgi:hypothetical protein